MLTTAKLTWGMWAPKDHLGLLHIQWLQSPWPKLPHWKWIYHGWGVAGEEKKLVCWYSCCETLKSLLWIDSLQDSRTDLACMPLEQCFIWSAALDSGDFCVHCLHSLLSLPSWPSVCFCNHPRPRLGCWGSHLWSSEKAQQSSSRGHFCYSFLDSRWCVCSF